MVNEGVGRSLCPLYQSLPISVYLHLHLCLFPVCLSVCLSLCTTDSCSSIYTQGLQNKRSAMQTEREREKRKVSQYISYNESILSIFSAWHSISVLLSVCPSVYLSVHLSVYLSVYMSICLSVYLPVYLNLGVTHRDRQRETERERDRQTATDRQRK